MLNAQNQQYYDSVVALATMSELIPIGDIAQERREDIRKTVDIALVQHAIADGVAPSADGLVLRDALPTTDWGLTGGASATGEQWIIAAAGVAGTAQNYINARQLTTTQVAAFWSVSGAVAPSNISKIRFLFGPGSAQVKMVIQLEKLLNRLEPEGYLSTPLIYDVQDTVSVEVLPMIAFAANSERLVLGSRICDRFALIVSARNTA